MVRFGSAFRHFTGMYKKPFVVVSVVLNLLLLTAGMFVLARPEHLVTLRSALRSVAPQEKCIPCDEVASVLNLTSIDNPTEQIDALRHFVHANSRHNETSSYYRENALQLEQRFTVIEDLVSHHTTATSPPDLACTARSWALFELLTHSGFDVRLVDLYFTEKVEPLSFSSHTFVEVFNPLTRAWEVHDPDGDLYYLNTSEKRLSTLDLMVHANRDEVRACHTNSQCPDSLRYWLNQPQAFRAVKIGFLGTNRNQDVVLIDDDHFDLYCELASPAGKRLIDVLQGRHHLIVF